jgi:hypothetical protein
MLFPSPWTADGADVRGEMIAYIRRHFGDLLGEHAALLDREDGLDEIARLLREGKIGPSL